MKSRTLLLAGSVGAGVLAIVAIAAAAAASELWWLVTAAAMTLLGAAFLAALDADRRAIGLRAHLGKELKRIRAEIAAAPSEPLAESSQEVLGAVRLLQAQYTGRLDRLQGSIENTLERQRSSTSATTSEHRAAE